MENRNQTNCDVFNLGTGDGLTVLEIINEFEKTTGVKLNYEIGPRRSGDVVAIYANNDKAKNLLGWIPKYSLHDMMDTAWRWELKLKEDQKIFTTPNSDLN